MTRVCANLYVLRIPIRYTRGEKVQVGMRQLLGFAQSLQQPATRKIRLTGAEWILHVLFSAYLMAEGMD